MRSLNFDSEEKAPFLDSAKPKDQTSSRYFLTSRRLVIGQSVVIILLIALNAITLTLHRCDNHLCLPRTRIWSPAEDAIRYINQRFNTGTGLEETQYQGYPSAKVDAAWERLYHYGISRIPREQAQQLHNGTVPIPGDPGYYIVGLDVFHQLHCLDMLRKRVWIAGKSLAEENETDRKHTDHCIQSLRQYVMCNADISPILWRWTWETNSSRPIASTYHTCRDFDALHEWAEQHVLQSFDALTYVEDDLSWEM